MRSKAVSFGRRTGVSTLYFDVRIIRVMLKFLQSTDKNKEAKKNEKLKGRFAQRTDSE